MTPELSNGAVVRRVLAIVITAFVSVAVLVAEIGPAHAKAKKLEVVAAFYPLKWAVEQIGGANVLVKNLTPAGVEPHDLELTPAQRDTIEDARLVVLMGKGFQPAIEDAAEERDENTLEVLDELPIDAVGKTVEEHEHEEGAEEGAEHAKDDEHADGGDEATLDPHVWLDPVLMHDVVHAVTDALVKADKQHAKQYRSNAADLQSDLEGLDGEFSAGLANCERTLLVTAHEAFGHLADRYGLTHEGVAGLAPNAEPAPDRLGAC